MNDDAEQGTGVGPPLPCCTDALLIVDAPNVDAVVGRMLGRAPSRHERFDPSALSAWMKRHAPNDMVERALFTNVTSPIRPGVEGWIRSLVDTGWRVFARPKLQPHDDIDEAMLAHLGAKNWNNVVVFSHDSRCFAAPLSAMGKAGVAVTVLGFRESAGHLPDLAGVDFIDVDTVEGLFREMLPRVRFTDLPAGGGWIQRTVA
jgi:uncharacterized protein